MKITVIDKNTGKEVDFSKPENNHIKGISFDGLRFVVEEDMCIDCYSGIALVPIDHTKYEIRIIEE